MISFDALGRGAEALTKRQPTDDSARRNQAFGQTCAQDLIALAVAAGA